MKNDKRLVLDYLYSERESVFKFDSTSTYTGLDTVIDSADTQANFELLTDGYNDADSDIGTYVSYFLIELTVTA